MAEDETQSMPSQSDENDDLPSETKNKSEVSVAEVGHSNKWLVALNDPTPGINCMSQCMILVDLNNDGENKLVLADLGDTKSNMKLKVYKNTSLAVENTITDLPVGIAAFYLDQNSPRAPAIAVASGSAVFIYKNMRPFFKFALPALPLNPVEEEIWKEVKENRATSLQLRNIIEDLRNQGASLTSVSQKVLVLHPDQLDDFVMQYRTAPLKRSTVLTCLDTLKKSYPDDDAISCLVLGTEDRQAIVLDPEAFTILITVYLPSVPVFLSCSGLFDVEYRIIVACRDGVIYQIKRGIKEVTKGIDVKSQPVGLVRVGKGIVVACMDHSVKCYTTKGKELYRLTMPSTITSLANMNIVSRGVSAAIVAMEDGTVRIYKEKTIVDEMKVKDAVTGICFGRYGREDGTLIMVTRSGAIMIYILKRGANFSGNEVSVGPPAAQLTRLPLPKKTRLFVDQTLHERECAVSMHRQFLHDLYRLRLMTSESYVEALETKATPVSDSKEDPVRLSATVNGVGPVFRLNVSLLNTSITNAVYDLGITFSYDGSMYRLERVYIPVPYLVPGLTYTFCSFVECISDKGISDTIKIYVIKDGKDSPLLTGVVNMPVSDTLVT